jgi:hypothetical protein
MTTDPLFGDPISVYSREQMLADGQLSDIDSWDPRDAGGSITREAGYAHKVYATAGVRALADVAVTRFYNDYPGIAWDLLFMAKQAIKHLRTDGPSSASFRVIINPKTLDLRLGFDGEAFTIMLPEED